MIGHASFIGHSTAIPGDVHVMNLRRRKYRGQLTVSLSIFCNLACEKSMSADADDGKADFLRVGKRTTVVLN